MSNWTNWTDGEVRSLELRSEYLIVDVRQASDNAKESRKLQLDSRRTNQHNKISDWDFIFCFNSAIMAPWSVTRISVPLPQTKNIRAKRTQPKL